MSKKDTVTKAFMRENAVFADAFNYLIFNGKKVIQPEQLRELDTTELVQLVVKGKITNVTIDLSEETEEVDMCKAIDDMMQDSRKEGILFVLTGLVRDGVLSIKDAASRANMTESAFEAAMKKNQTQA